MGNNTIKNLVSLPRTSLSLLANVIRQKRYIRKYIRPDIRSARRMNDGSLDEDDFRKIEKYYGFGVPAILGESFCTLRGSKMSAKERKASTYLGAATGLFDDFFDKRQLSRETINRILENPREVMAGTSNDKLSVYFYTNFLDNIDNDEVAKKAVKNVFYAQLEGEKQKNEGLTDEEIKEITFRKGGYSLLIYRSAFSNPMHEGEYEALFNIGAYMQLGNDIFDVYEDLKAGVHTLVTRTAVVHKLRRLYIEQMTKAFELCWKMDYPEKNIARFLQKISLGMARCFVALNQYEKLEERTGGVFIPSEYKRKELICDMEKIPNILRSVCLYLKYYQPAKL